ncbi:Hypothetical predicted protein [Pelobates cultripes]|uniref:Uncharacterized protein n=1 Tax=Pelobates cultripes TaxID=61616 RepID=A0AAD1W9V1_PELCU|nr:Hypothetical predicted protein [Pelobates cultripes]
MSDTNIQASNKLHIETQGEQHWYLFCLGSSRLCNYLITQLYSLRSCDSNGVFHTCTRWWMPRTTPTPVEIRQHRSGVDIVRFPTTPDSLDHQACYLFAGNVDLWGHQTRSSTHSKWSRSTQGELRPSMRVSFVAIADFIQSCA